MTKQLKLSALVAALLVSASALLLNLAMPLTSPPNP